MPLTRSIALADPRQADDAGRSWTADRLRAFVRTTFPGERLVVLSNREPLLHERGRDGRIQARQPASGVAGTLHAAWLARQDDARRAMNARPAGPT